VSASDEKKILQTILDYLPCGVTLFDEQFGLLAHNDQFLRLLDFPRQLVESGAPTFQDFLRYNAERGEYGPGDPEELVQRAMERARRREPHVLERERPNSAVVEIRGQPVPNGGFITIYTDITERRHAEQALRLAKAQLEQLALHDPLTGLANRRKLAERFDHEAARAQRSRAPISLLMIDIDRFKAINDRHGHAAGDACLKRLAEVLQSSGRAIDLATRLGGEEFAVLLPETDPDGARRVAERMRERVQATGFGLPGSVELLHATISVGVATLSGPGPAQLEELLARADEALYRAKQGGRNRVTA
jgi:diguanylate cyclase (GGDEF)-like protein